MDNCPFCNKLISVPLFFSEFRGECPMCHGWYSYKRYRYKSDHPEPIIFPSSIRKPITFPSSIREKKIFKPSTILEPLLNKEEVEILFKNPNLSKEQAEKALKNLSKKELKQLLNYPTKPAPNPVSKSIVGIEITGTTNEFVCVYEKGKIDNSKSPAEVEKTISVEYKLFKTFDFETNKVEIQGLKLNIGYLFMGFEGEAKKEIKERFHLELKTEITAKEELKIKAHAREEVEYTINVMRKLHLGKIEYLVKFDDNTKRVVKVPFKQAYGILFDVKTEGRVSPLF